MRERQKGILHRKECDVMAEAEASVMRSQEPRKAGSPPEGVKGEPF